LNNKILDIVSDCFENKKQVDNLIHKKMMDLLKEYIVVGGMPEIVNIFLETKNFSKVLEKQKIIVEEYKNDIAKYSESNEIKIRGLECYESIPSQLSKENKKFKFNIVDKNSKYKKGKKIYESSLL
jgi:uncharacterized pyridoxal phosphate-containing UPF0001 family protein